MCAMPTKAINKNRSFQLKLFISKHVLAQSGPPPIKCSAKAHCQKVKQMISKKKNYL